MLVRNRCRRRRRCRFICRYVAVAIIIFTLIFPYRSKKIFEYMADLRSAKVNCATYDTHTIK